MFTHQAADHWMCVLGRRELGNVSNNIIFIVYIKVIIK